MKVRSTTHCGACDHGVMDRGMYESRDSSYTYVFYVCDHCDRVCGNIVKAWEMLGVDGRGRHILGLMATITRHELDQNFTRLD